MKSLDKKFIFRTLLMLLFICTVLIVEAQCPMCKMSAESNLADGGTEGRALNKGILYLLALPYTMVMVLGVVWYRNRKSLSQKKDS